MMRLILNSIIALCLISSVASAQESGNFSEKTLPNNSKESPALEKKSEIKPPIAEVEVNKPTSIISSLKDSISSLLVQKKSSSSSLMFDDEQISNIDRAIDALKNNQQFVPEGEEGKKSESAKDDEKDKEKDPTENEKSFVFLASIIYFSSKDWAVWINDQKFTSQTNDKNKELFISSVDSDSAKVTWKLSLSKWRILSGQKSDATPPNLNENNQVQLEFELKPNQTFALNTNKVIEGRAAAALIKIKNSSQQK